MVITQDTLVAKATMLPPVSHALPAPAIKEAARGTEYIRRLPYWLRRCFPCVRDEWINTGLNQAKYKSVGGILASRTHQSPPKDLQN